MDRRKFFQDTSLVATGALVGCATPGFADDTGHAVQSAGCLHSHRRLQRDVSGATHLLHRQKLCSPCA